MLSLSLLNRVVWELLYQTFESKFAQSINPQPLLKQTHQSSASYLSKALKFSKSTISFEFLSSDFVFWNNEHHICILLFSGTGVVQKKLKPLLMQRVGSKLEILLVPNLLEISATCDPNECDSSFLWHQNTEKEHTKSLGEKMWTFWKVEVTKSVH